MSVKLFVDVNDTFDVEVFAFNDEKGNLVATADPKEVSLNTEPEKLKFIFRRACYKDSTNITSASISTELDGKLKIDMIQLQDAAFRTLLVSWNLTDSDGNNIVMNMSNIDKLDPLIVRIASAEVLTKLKI